MVKLLALPRIARGLSMLAPEPVAELFPLAVDKVGGFGKAMLEPGLDLSKERNFVGQQIDPNQDREDALARRDEHDHACCNAQPASHVLEHEFGMPVPEQMFHRGWIIQDGKKENHGLRSAT
jgi:hypothetical protein